ncbi:MAG TPA: hypothetical protein PKD20_01005 [Candidatus Saccharibacteria bacterium]|nr:hypothetical protein [Candidatus Saccharibacteria bacterium]HMT55434.1 hypothetical protein [Candidatus Saccharibacteria bacterium]
MEQLEAIHNEPQEAVISLPKASALSVLVTMMAVLGAGHGGHLDETPSHITIPVLYNGVRHSRRIDE